MISSLAADMLFSGCGSAAVSENTAEEKKEPASETGAGKERPGAKWIDSGIFGTFKDLGEIRPQDDFAASVNRAWAESAVIKEGETRISAMSEQADRIKAEKIALLTGEKKDDKNLTALQNFYQLLLDWDARKTAVTTDLKPYVDDLMSISSVDEMTAYYSDPNRCLYSPAMLEDEVTVDAEDVFSNLLIITNPAMLSEDDSGYGEPENEMFSAKRQISEYMLAKLGYSQSEAKDLFDRAKAFETGFLPGFESMKQKMMELGPSVLESRFSPEELQEKYANLPICGIYKAWGYDLNGRIAVVMPDVIEAYDANYTNENIENIKAWTLIHTLEKVTVFLDRETYEETAKLSTPLTGQDSVKTDEAYAWDNLKAFLPSLLDQIYVDYCFDKELKPQVAELVDLMLDAYREMLEAEEWMSDETKKAAIEKLDHMKKNVCYPENLPDNGDITIQSPEEGGSLLEAVKAARIYQRHADAGRLSRKNDGTYWKHTIRYGNFDAIYSPADNSLNICAGMCGGDYYDPDWPLEKKLGGLCMVIGHEITHAFDTRGARYDKDGNMKNWWTEKDMAEFAGRVDRLNAYYSALVPSPQISDVPYGMEGAERISGEAIADLGSMKCLLSIAKKQNGFDYAMFFTQAAVIQRLAIYEKEEMKYIAADPHPVYCFRCNIPVQNFDEFIETFGVKEGDGMYLAPKDRIAVW